jgi:polyisoprenoid-binding protein YceI
MATPTLQRPTAATSTGSTWRIDAAHSTIGFAVKHMRFTTVHGRFSAVAGTIRLAPDHIARSRVDVTIDTASIDTGVGARDAHLRSADFFDVERYPVASFHSTRVAGTAHRLVVDGDLTIRGVTQPISLTGAYQGTGIDPSGVEVAGFEATGRLDRKAFGLGWNQALESGGVLVGNEVRLTLELQARRVDS